MARLMLAVGLAAAVFLLDPQWASRQIDVGLEAIGWRRTTVSPIRLATPKHPRDSVTSERHDIDRR